LHVLTALADGFLALGIWGVFVGMALESAAIPIPSEVLLPFAGYLVATGHAAWWEAGLIAMAGGTLGAVASYAVAYAVGSTWGSRAHGLDRAQRWFERYGEAAVFFGRLVPGVRTYISLPAGLARMRFGRFLAYSVLGALPWTVVFIYLGYTFGGHWQQALHDQVWVYGVGALVVVAWALWFLARRRRAV
jgi:membrane protein DedA with SNARE-associated domain